MTTTNAATNVWVSKESIAQALTSPMKPRSRRRLPIVPKAVAVGRGMLYIYLLWNL